MESHGTSDDDIVIFHPSVSRRDINLALEASNLGERATILTCVTIGVIAIMSLTYVVTPFYLKALSVIALLASLALLYLILHLRVIKPLQTRLQLTQNDRVVVFLLGSRSAQFYNEQFERFGFIPDEDVWAVKADIFPILLIMLRAESAMDAAREEGLDEGDPDYDVSHAEFQEACSKLRKVIDLYVRDEPA